MPQWSKMSYINAWYCVGVKSAAGAQLIDGFARQIESTCRTSNTVRKHCTDRQCLSRVRMATSGHCHDRHLHGLSKRKTREAMAFVDDEPATMIGSPRIERGDRLRPRPGRRQKSTLYPSTLFRAWLDATPVSSPLATSSASKSETAVTDRSIPAVRSRRDLLSAPWREDRWIDHRSSPGSRMPPLQMRPCLVPRSGRSACRFQAPSQCAHVRPSRGTSRPLWGT